MGITIRPAAEADAAAIAEVSLNAFDPSSDAISRALFPGGLNNDNLKSWILQRKTARINLKGVTVMVATDDELDERIVGYSVWLRPVVDETDAPAPPPKREVKGMDMEAMEKLKKIIIAEEEAVLGDQGSKHVWNLDSLGVAPEQQRRGIGRKLLTWGLDKAVEEGRDAFLVATPSGLGLYKSAGFEEVRKTVIFGETHVSMVKHHKEK